MLFGNLYGEVVEFQEPVGYVFREVDKALESFDGLGHFARSRRLAGGLG